MPKVRDLATRTSNVIQQALGDDHGNLASGQIAPATTNNVLRVLNRSVGSNRSLQGS